MDFGNTPPQFIFPVLKTPDILQCMSELNIELSKAELSEPHRHKEGIRTVFLKLLETCCGVEETDLEPSKAVLDKAATMPFPDMHEGTSDIKFFLKLRKCLRTCGIYDFSWKDLHAPTPKRLRWQLSAIVNMAKFREDQLMVYHELHKPRAEYLLCLDDVNREHEELKAQFEEARAKSEEDFVAMEQVAKECEALTKQIAQSNKIQASKREEASALKRKANDLKDELATATWALEESEAEEERLRSQIVSSPDRRQEDLRTKREGLDYLREECSNLEDNLQSIKTKCGNVSTAIKTLKSQVVIVEQVREEAQKYVETSGNFETTSEELDAVQKKSRDMGEKICLSERDLNRLDENLLNQQKQYETKMEGAQKSLDSAKSRLLSVENDRNDAMKRVEAGEARVRELESSIEDDRVENETDIESMIKDFKDTENEVIALWNKRIQVL